jgi:hypothetical protein
MSDYDQLSDACAGLCRLAMAGVAAMFILTLLAMSGLGYLAFWAWNHLGVTVH